MKFGLFHRQIAGFDTYRNLLTIDENRRWSIGKRIISRRTADLGSDQRASDFHDNGIFINPDAIIFDMNNNGRFPLPAEQVHRLLMQRLPNFRKEI